jgi:cullin-associated NEDD8-dissociated protein 1
MPCFHSQNVRRVALVAFNSAAHNKPSLIRDLLDTLLPNLYKETKIRVSSLLKVLLGCHSRQL